MGGLDHPGYRVKGVRGGGDQIDGAFVNVLFLITTLKNIKLVIGEPRSGHFVLYFTEFGLRRQ